MHLLLNGANRAVQRHAPLSIWRDAKTSFALLIFLLAAARWPIA
jgi:hypothetical protein